MLRFPFGDLLDDRACHDFLLEWLHPHGLVCPRGHPLPPTQAPHDRHRAPIVAYRCRVCGAGFNHFTGTIWARSHYPCSTIMRMLRGVPLAMPTTQLAEDLGIDRGPP